jgi:hypothetical protein
MSSTPRSLTLVPLSLIIAGLAVGAASDAQARPGNPNAGHRHDPGHFFMRLSAGAGFNSMGNDDSGETTLSGIGGMGSFAFGATVAPNIALGVDLFGLSMFEPSVEQNGNDLGDAENTRASLGAIGIGATFYVMPANLYFAGSIGAGVASLEFRGRFGGLVVNAKEDSEVGLAANIMVGKEWWVARNWGIGIAAQAVFASLETDSGAGLNVFGLGLLFSATMN